MSHNTWLHRLARVTVVRPLLRTSVTPNQVTTARLAMGIAAAVAVGTGNTLAMQIGAALFTVAMLLDRADGDLARTRKQTSASGHRYDLIADTVCNTLIFVGLGAAMVGGRYGLFALVFGLLAGAAVVSILWMVLRLEALAGERAGELSGGGGFDPDDAMIVAPVCIWLGAGEGLLLVAATVAPTFAILFYFIVRKRSSVQPVHRQ